MKSFLFIVSAALLALTCSTPKNTGEGPTEKQVEIKRLIDSQDYTFKAQSVLPQRGRMRQLTSEYDLQVSKDTILAFLPYFGRAFTAPMDPTQGGIQFVSTRFGYEATDRKNGGWEIGIKPGDVRTINQMNLRVDADGYASLQVISTNRENISFNGYIARRSRR